LNVWSLLVCSDTLSSKWVNIPGRIWFNGTGDYEVPVTFANGEGTDDDEREIIIKLIPSVVETMKNHGQLETWIQFNQLLSTQSFPETT
jgi:hypothetical protein